MAFPFRSTLRGSRYSASTILSNLFLRPLSHPHQQAAAITRALHTTSRHTLRTATRRTPQHPHHQPRRPFSSSSPRKNPNSTPRSSHNTSNPTPPPPPSSEEASLSLSARFRKLSREYGWSAVGVYFLLSALDFPFCFLAVRSLGAETIGHYEHLVVGYVSAAIPEGVKESWEQGKGRVMEMIDQARGEEHQISRGTSDGGAGVVSGGGERGQLTTPVIAGEQGRVEAYSSIPPNSTSTSISSSSSSSPIAEVASTSTGSYGQDVMAADRAAHRSDASIWTQLALAYAIHKSFIFVRVPLTVAVTPRVVKVLRGWGWDIGKRRTKEVREAGKKAREAVELVGRRKGS